MSMALRTTRSSRSPAHARDRSGLGAPGDLGRRKAQDKRRLRAAHAVGMKGICQNTAAQAVGSPGAADEALIPRQGEG